MVGLDPEMKLPGVLVVKPVLLQRVLLVLKLNKLLDLDMEGMLLAQELDLHRLHSQQNPL